MKRLKVENNQVNFIGSWKLENDEISKNIINFFENNKFLQTQGRMDNGINLNEKNTTDMTIDPIDLKDQKYFMFKEYFDELYKCYLDYKKQLIHHIIHHQDFLVQHRQVHHFAVNNCNNEDYELPHQ